MPTRKKGPARNATVEHVNTKTSRHPRRSTSSAVPDKKVNDLITSSSKKQKPAENLQKKNEVLSGGRKLTSPSDSTDTENEVANVPSSSMLDHKVTDPAIDRTSAEIACTLDKKLKAVAKKSKGGSQKVIA